MVSFMTQFLKDIWKHRLGGDHTKLPEAIIIFRDGVSDGQLKECATKEYVGIQRACKIFAEDCKIKIKVGGKEKFWKPKLQFVVVQQRILDRFGVPQGNRIFNPRQPMVLVNPHMEGKLFDFVG